jgi:hypothetical protein
MILNEHTDHGDYNNLTGTQRSMCSEVTHFWQLLSSVEVDRKISCLGLIALVHDCERVNTLWQWLGPLAHCAKALVGNPLVFLLVDRIVIIVLEVKDNVVIRVTFTTWEVSIRVHLGCDIQVLLNWIIDLEPVLSLTGIQLFLHVFVWLVDGNGKIVKLLDICLKWHPENAIVLLFKINLLPPLVGPVLIIISPWTFIHLGGPWVTKFSDRMLDFTI